MPKYTIEINSEQNRNYIFPIDKMRCRGRWDFSRTFHRTPSDELKALAQVAKVIPGECLSLNTDDKSGRKFDPLLETEEGRRLFAAMNAVFEAHSFVFGGKKRLEEAVTYKNLTNDQVKEWLFYMRSAVDGGLATLVPGSAKLPSLDEIRAMKGKRRRDPMSNARDDVEGPFSRYVDIVEDKTPVGSDKDKA